MKQFAINSERAWNKGKGEEIEVEDERNRLQKKSEELKLS